MVSQVTPSSQFFESPWTASDGPYHTVQLPPAIQLAGPAAKPDDTQDSTHGRGWKAGSFAGMNRIPLPWFPPAGPAHGGAYPPGTAKGTSNRRLLLRFLMPLHLVRPYLLTEVLPVVLQAGSHGSSLVMY